MSLQGELLAMLETVAEALGDDLCQQVVFVGGCSTAVLITDEITLQEVRATDDVDLIVGLTGMAQWMQLQKTLGKKGFTVSGEDKVICRMRLGNLKVDFMPDDPDILGFSNRWYKEGISTAIKYVLPSGRVIKHLTPPLFLATKLEASVTEARTTPSEATTWKTSSMSWMEDRRFWTKPGRQHTRYAATCQSVFRRCSNMRTSRIFSTEISEALTAESSLYIQE